ncbi:MAG: tetratricopeptide repeat protein [Gemmataceae bacterium]|nr:tetratricopeptide repeat protein [Gemmataceae bacterium]
MTLSTPTNSSGQPSLTDLMVRFLATRSDAASAPAVESAEGEVEPYEVAAGFRVDPRAAWIDAMAATQTAPVPTPNDWAGLVNQPAAVFAVALAAGNFPQRVKDIHPLLTRFEPTELRPTDEQVPAAGLSGLRTWVVREMKKGKPASTLLAAGVARAIGEFDWAGELLADAETGCTGDLRAVWENERAALLWHSGRGDEALAAWTAMADTPAVLFNRGMAQLFLARPADARAALMKAVETLPESGGWNALARLYLAIAEIHG